MNLTNYIVRHYARINEILSRRGLDPRVVALNGLDENGYYRFVLGADGKPKMNGFGTPMKVWTEWPPGVREEIRNALQITEIDRG